MKNYAMIAALFLSSVAYAQTPKPTVAAVATPLSEPASVNSAKISIKTEPLMNRTVAVQLNGRVITTMEGRQTYSGVFSPGQARLTVGDKPQSIIELNVEPNKEYVFAVELVASAGGGAMFGIFGSVAMGTFSIALKETKEMFAVPQAPPPAQQTIQPSQAKAAPIPVSAPSVDYIAEAKKSARILGCPTEDVRLTGAENNNILMSANCGTGLLLLTCDSSGVCLRR